MRGRRKNNRYKFLVIIFTLVIPVAVYLFLRGFGENHFSVPVFYENGIPADSTACNTARQPHLVSLQSALEEQPGETFYNLYEQKLTVIDIDMDADSRPGKPGYPLNRVADIFAGNPDVQFILLRPGTMAEPVKQSPSDDRFIYIQSISDKIIEFARCELILLDFPDSVDSQTRRLVVIDGQGRIRGYYQAGDFDEIDRMVLEMKIILTEEF